MKTQMGQNLNLLSQLMMSGLADIDCKILFGTSY